MIKMFSRVATRGLDVSFGVSMQEAEGPVVCRSASQQTAMTSQPLSVEALYAHLPAVPRVPWRHVAGLCGSTLRAVQATLHEDFENAAPFFAELEFGDSDAQVSNEVMNTRLRTTNAAANGM